MVSSGVWGNEEREITQGFGVNLESIPDNWYAYAADWGFPYGTHIGVDVGMPRETPIYAAAAGIVTQAGWSDAFRPNPVTVETPDDPATPEDDREQHIYGHLWREAVSAGERVEKGQLIGYSGEQTVRGTMEPDGSGPHLHFERRDLSEQIALDPMPLLNGQISPRGGGTVRIDPAAINARIQKSEASNGSTSPLRGKGETIVAFGERYGINPAVVVAIMQRENQLGAATNDVLIPYNNFGGNTAVPGVVEGTAGTVVLLGRTWQKNATVDDGIEAIFKNLDSDLYRDTGGRFEDVMALYSPPFENDWADMWTIFEQVGRDLSVQLGPDTNIYQLDAPGNGGGNSGSLVDWDAMVRQISGAVSLGAQRTGVAVIGLVGLALGVALVFPGAAGFVPGLRAIR